MDILVFSDSHHDTASMIYVLESMTPDMVIHLGDNVHDARTLEGLFPEIAFQTVGGNCDFENIESEKTITLENTRFFITHGHRYGVKSGLGKVIKKGMDEKADIILFGHTHKSYIQNQDRTWIVNPGSISRIYKMGDHPSYAKITIENGEVACQIVERK
jgi:putative phosphoesterase